MHPVLDVVDEDIEWDAGKGAALAKTSFQVERVGEGGRRTVAHANPDGASPTWLHQELVTLATCAESSELGEHRFVRCHVARLLQIDEQGERAEAHLSAALHDLDETRSVRHALFQSTEPSLAGGGGAPLTSF
jgi:hypothetical protein